MSSKDIKRYFLCECTKASILSEDTVSLEFKWPGPAPLGGQFFLIKPRRTSVFLGRPISVAGFKAGTLRFLIARRGRGSTELAEMRPGEKAELTGPLGNSWPVDNLTKTKPIALVSGGVGIASLLMLANKMGKNPVDFYAGFRRASFGLESIKARTLIVSTENGSEGKKGRILDFFKAQSYGTVFGCGPEPMLKALADICIAAGIHCFLSIERHMACGVGACLACKVKTARGNLNCCVDGPIFKAEELCFEG